MLGVEEDEYISLQDVDDEYGAMIDDLK